MQCKILSEGYLSEFRFFEQHNKMKYALHTFFRLSSLTILCTLRQGNKSYIIDMLAKLTPTCSSAQSLVLTIAFRASQVSVMNGSTVCCGDKSVYWCIHALKSRRIIQWSPCHPSTNVTRDGRIDQATQVSNSHYTTIDHYSSSVYWHFY